VILPVLDEALHLPRVLADLAGQVPAPREILAVDGGSTDGTRGVAEAGGARVLTAARGRGPQLRAGARAAVGEILFFLHADTRLPPGALGMVERVLAGEVVGGRFRVRFPHPHPVLDLLSLLSRLPWAWASFGDAGCFVAREVYERTGGFEEIPLFEDVRFHRRLRKAGPTCVLPVSVTTSCRRFCECGPGRQLLLNAMLVTGHRLGVSPARLAAWYGRKPRSLSLPRHLC
jgi:rSAM/selenodomain-associated transferase 2